MPSCSVKWCSNHTSTCSLKSKNGVSFHRFPKDEAICQKWVEAVRHERRDPWWTSSNASRICSLHFKESDISSTPCKVNILSKTAVPVCTMVWYDENQNNITSKTSEKSNTDITYLKTDEHKNTNVNVLRESKVNIFNKFNEEETTISETNKVVVSNITPYPPSQLKEPQELDTELLKAWKVTKIHKLKEFLEFHNIACISLTTSANEVTKKTVLNEKEYAKSYKEKYRKLKINDNTSFILDDDLCNDIEFKESSIFINEPNIRTCENSLKVDLNECKSNENKNPNQNITNISNKDEIVETKKIYNGDSNANILINYEYKKLKTYMPKRKNKISEIKIKGTCEHLTENDDIMSIDSEKELNAIKCVEVNNSNVNVYPNNDLKLKFSTTASPNSNIIADLQSNKNAQDKNEPCAFKNVNIVNTPTIINQYTTVCKELNLDTNKETNIVNLDELITNQSRIDINGNEKTVYDEIISELFENSKHVSGICNSKYRESNENLWVEPNKKILGQDNINSALNKQSNNVPVIFNLDTNIHTELNTLVNLELSNELEYNADIDTKVNTDKRNDKKFTQLDENTLTKSHQQLPFMNNHRPMENSDYLISKSQYDLNSESNRRDIMYRNKNMYYNESNTNIEKVLSNKKLQNIKTSVNNIVTDSNKDNFTELRKHLTLKPKLDSFADLYTNTVTDINKNLFSKCNKIMSTVLTKENPQVPDKKHAEYDKNIELNNKLASLQTNVNTEGTILTESNVTKPKQLSSILPDEFLTNSSPVSNYKENVNFINNLITDPNPEKDIPKLDTVMNFELCSDFNIGLNDEINTADVNKELRQNPEKEMPKLDTTINLDFCGEVHIGLNDEINTEDVNTELQQKSGKDMPKLDTAINLDFCGEVHIGLNDEINIEDVNTELQQNPGKDMPKLDTAINLDFCSEVHIGLNDEINTEHVNSELQQNPGKDMPKLDTFMNFELGSEVNIVLNDEINRADVNTKLKQNLEKNMPDFDIVMNLDLCSEVNIGLNDEINTDDVIIELIQNPGKDNVSKLIKNPQPKSKKDINRKFNNLNIEMCYNKDLQVRNKNVESVLPLSDDQLIVVNEHLDVVDSILNRDTVEEFDVSLLLTDTPRPDEEIQNVDSNSNINLDSIKRSSNWIRVAADGIPKIIDDILDEASPVLENFDLFEKVNEFNLDKVVYQKDNKKPINENSTTSNFEQLEEILNNTSESLEEDKKHYDKKFDKETYKSRVDKVITVTLESVKKTKIQNQGNLKSSFQEINKQLSEVCNNKKRIDIVKHTLNEAHTQATKSIRELDSEQLNRAIFEQCCDLECGSNCKNEKHNSNNELYNEDVQQYKNSRNYTPYQSDNIIQKRDIDLFNKLQCNQSSVDNLIKQLNFESFKPNIKQTPLIEHHKLSDNEKCITKCKKIAIDQMSGKYLELRWKEKKEHSNNLSPNYCKRKRKELGCNPRKIQCTESTSDYKCLSTKRSFDLSNNNCENQNGSFSQVMAECPECGYTTDDIDLTTYKSDVDLRISKPLSLINKDLFLSQPDREAEDNNQNSGNNKRVALESVYAMELAYATAIQALERKLKQKIAISEYRQRKVNNLSKINDHLIKANTMLTNIAGANKL